MFASSQLVCLLLGLVLVIQTSSGHRAGTINNLRAMCGNDSSTGHPNLNPIDETPARLISKVENGTLYQIGSGEDQIWLAHVYGNNGYDYGFAYGTLLREQITQMIPRAWAYFEKQIIDDIKFLRLPQWFEDVIADKGLAFALDLQNDLVKKYVDPEIYSEIQGMSDASKVDYKMLMRLHMIGEITKGIL